MDAIVPTNTAVMHMRLEQSISTFVRPRQGKFFFYKTRARSQQIYSLNILPVFLSSYVKLT